MKNKATPRELRAIRAGENALNTPGAFEVRVYALGDYDAKPYLYYVERFNHAANADEAGERGRKNAGIVFDYIARIEVEKL